MKKGNSLFIAGIIVLSSVIPSFAINVHVNNQPITMDVAPVIVEGRTLVPVAAIAHTLNGQVSWEPTSKTVTIIRDSSKIMLQLQNKQANINGQNVILDVPAQVIEGRTMVPVEFIAQAFGEKVAWDSATKTVLINSDAPAATIAPVSQNGFKVVRVVDGDTIIINYNGNEERVRLTGVDTPESVHPDSNKNLEFGKVSSEFTKNYLEGKSVTLEFDVQERDRYGRILAYVYIDGKMFNNILLEEGMAKVATYPPNVKYVDTFTESEKKARENNKGLWALSTEASIPVMPPIVTHSANNPTPDPVITLDQSKDGIWIKGNKNSSIYHVPEGRDYNKLSPKNIVWFETEQEAQAAGYRRAMQ